MERVSDWLGKLGLSQYAQRFAENDISFVILPDLSDQDLEKIGVASLGHRRLLLRAIAELKSVDNTSLSPQPAASAPPAATKMEGAERRQVTVMFADLVGSTALSARMDPEDLREVISAYQKCVAETVQRLGGFVAKYMGDGVLVYFGYPHAHEDDAERAVRAGLDLIASIGALKTRAPLQTRVGIATGLVVVGDLIGSGASQEQAIVGETPNLAARLQGVAEPNRVVIAESTRKLVGDLFELEDLGAQDLKGISGPVRAWAALRPSSVESRFEAMHASRLTELVGREEELELLLRRWSKAKTGEGQVVLVSGEPGIGKSRLTVALQEHSTGEPHALLRYFCSPQHTDSALYPFIGQLERAFGFARDDTVEQKLGKLRAPLASGSQPDDHIALLSELMSLPSSAAGLNLSPQRKREKLFEVILSQLEAEARRRPVLMVFEDAHWIDPTSRELLDLTIDRVQRLPVMLEITFRPEFQPAWGGRSHVTSLALNRLGERDGEALVQELAGNAALSPDIVVEIVKRTDGVPLFVEELTKAVLESAGQGNRVAEVLATTFLAAQSVPATLHASLMARLDRLGPAAKEIAQIGAVIGREFGYELIGEVAQRSAADLRSGLDRLVEAGLLFCRGVVPLSSYLFKHALVQEAAYGTLLRTRRQELHARVAAVLKQRFADLVDRQPELLAHHLTAADDGEHAAGQWLRAGRHAAARSAHLEAISYFDRGLAILPTLPADSARDGQEIELQLAKGLSLLTTESFMSTNAANAYTRARELAERLDDTPSLFTAVYGLWQSTVASGMVVSASALSDRLLRLTESNADDGLRLQAHHSAWSTSTFAGAPTIAREHCEAGCRIYDPERHRSHRLLYGGHDPGVCAGCFAGQLDWLLGYPERGLALSRAALALAERIAHPFSLLEALLMNAMLHLDRGEPEMALHRLDAAEALAAEQRLSFMLEPRLLRGAALITQGAFAAAVTNLRQGHEAWRVNQSRPLGFALLATALVQQGEHAAALAMVRDGLKVQEQTGHGLWHAELHRFEGIALFSLSRLEESQVAFEEALCVARRQHARAYELRAAMSLARLWRDQGKGQQARELLAPVYGWFTEGFDTRDLKEAKTLLDALAS